MISSLCKAHLQKVKKHLDGCEKAEPIVLKLSLVIGTRDCHEVLARVDRLVLPSSRLELLQSDQAKFEAKLNDIEYPDISHEDFEISSGCCPLMVAN